MVVSVFCWNTGNKLRSTRIREPAILATVKEQDADILSLQECSPEAKSLLEEANPYRTEAAEANDTVILSRKRPRAAGALKLDWLFVRGVETRIIQAGPYLTDHRSLLTQVKRGRNVPEGEAERT